MIRAAGLPRDLVFEQGLATGDEWWLRDGQRHAPCFSKNEAMHQITSIL